MPSLTPDEARRHFLTSPVARLATVSAAGDPHLVPVTFAAAGPDTLVTAVDHKPKRTLALARLANIAANPSVCLLVDHYEDDWTRLWWARADGHAMVLGVEAESPARTEAAAHLVERYAQYRDVPPAGPLIVVDVQRWTGWTAAD